MSISTVT